MAEYIDKDKFMVILANIAKIKAKSEAQKSLMGRCMFCLDKMSAKDVVEIKERKVGKWIEVWESQRDEFSGEYDEWREHKCSICDFQEMDADRFNYCPNCGADMRGSENDI